MPIYEYHCEPCDHTFETPDSSRRRCRPLPRCGNIDVAKQFSVPAAAQSHSGRSSLPICGNAGAAGYGCGRPECGSGACALRVSGTGENPFGQATTPFSDGTQP